MEDLHVESIAKGFWAALFEQMQQALHVIEESMSAGNTHEDLRLMSGSGAFAYI